MRFVFNLDYYLFYILIFILPFGKHLFIPVLFAWICFSALSNFALKDNDFHRRLRSFLVLPILVYAIHLLSLVTSTNFSGAVFDLQLKLSILLLPILFPFQRLNYAKNLRKFLLTFIIGCVVASLYYLGYACYRSFSIVNSVLVFNPVPAYWWNNYFLSYELSYLIHPSYFALYILVALLIVGLEVKRWWRKTLVVRVVSIGAVTVLMVTLILLQSRAGILGLVLLGAALFVKFIIGSKRYFLGVAIMVMMFFLVFIVLSRFNRMMYTAKSLETAALTGLQNPNKEDGTTIRIWIWTSALSIIMDHPIFGVGTGDVRNELQKQYKLRGMTTSAQFRHNAHNEYLETWLGTGIFGLLALLAMILLPLWVGIKKGDWLVVGFLSLCSVSFMFESMLNTIAGVGFFAIFYTILVSNLAFKQDNALAPDDVVAK